MKLADASGVSHFAQGLRFDLANALPGDLELPADFLESARIAVAQTEAQSQDFLLPVGQARKHGTYFVSQ